MMTVHEASRLAGVSVRTLQYYDKIGLLRPSGYTDSGYRLYDDAALEKLQQILLFRELEVPLKEIKEILSSPDFDRHRALKQQIELLTMKKEHLENLIHFARGLQSIGVRNMDFSVFDTKKMDEYAKRAKEQWGKTPEYEEYERKTKERTPDEEKEVEQQLMRLFAEFGELKDHNSASPKVQGQVRKLQNFISEYFYKCTKEILSSLGQMYAGGGEMTQNIDKMGGKGTAVFVAKAIQTYCKN